MDGEPISGDPALEDLARTRQRSDVRIPLVLFSECRIQAPDVLEEPLERFGLSGSAVLQGGGSDGAEHGVEVGE